MIHRLDPSKLIREMSSREIRTAWIQLRREKNATARRLGFKNDRAWHPEDYDPESNE